MESEEATHPMHQWHPEHPDNHQHRKHHPHSALIRGILAIFLLVVLVLMFFVGFLTDAPFGRVILAFLPSIILGLIGVVLLNNDEFDIKYLFFALIAVLILTSIIFFFLLPGGDIAAITGINLLLGALLVLIVAQAYRTPAPTKVIELEPEQRDLPTLIGTLEDRCKAINFVIGRVYNVHHGANAAMRNRINIDREWYNEITEAKNEDEEENENIIRGALEKIKRRLEQLDDKEHNIFSESELKKIKKLEREKNGRDSIRDVLAKNDSDPVEQYIISALQYATYSLDKLNED